MPDWGRRAVFGGLFAVAVVVGSYLHPLVMEIMWGGIGLWIWWEFAQNERFGPLWKAVGGSITLAAWIAKGSVLLGGLMPWTAGGLLLLAAALAIEWRSVWASWTIWWWNGLFLWGVAGLALEGGGFHPERLLAVVFTVWVHDVAAYVVGNLVGGPRMAPSLSPGKRWSGAIGGWLIGGVVGAALMHYWVMMPPVVAWAAALAATLGAFFGDLGQSAWKRRLHIKDSGSFLPGHGGVLDRMDALMVAAPASYAVIRWLAAF